MPFSARQGFFGGNAWTPQDTTTLVWLHVDDTSTYEVTDISGSDYITTWYNQSGTDFVNNTDDAPAFPPGGNAAVVGIGIEFGPSADEFLRANTTFLSNTNPNFMCVMMCSYNDNDFGGTNYAISVGDGNGRIEVGVSDQDMPGPLSWNHGDGNSDHGDVASGAGQVITSWQRSSGTDYSDDAVYLFGNVSARTASSGLTNSPNLSGNTTLAPPGVLTYAGTITELIIAESDSDDTRQRLEGYLAWKFGKAGELPASHPYKNEPPGT